MPHADSRDSSEGIARWRTPDRGVRDAQGQGYRRRRAAFDGPGRLSGWLPPLPGSRGADAPTHRACSSVPMESARRSDGSIAAADAYQCAISSAGQNDKILVFGSFFTVGAVVARRKTERRRSAEFMAKAITDEELQLKKRARRRLVGAVALVLLIVVFLPMILDSEPKPLNQDIAINIPPIPKPESDTGESRSPISCRCPLHACHHHAWRACLRPAVEPDPAPSVETKPDLPSSVSAKAGAKPVPKAVQKHEISRSPSQRMRAARKASLSSWVRFPVPANRQGAGEEVAGQQVQGLYRTRQERERRSYARAGGPLPDTRSRG